MSDRNSNLTITKKISFILVITITSLIIMGLIVTGYFTFKKFNLSYDYCKSFGEIDSEIGWTLKKDIDSCLILQSRITKEVFFDTKIYTDNYGFRTDKFGNTSLSSILAIGDSWTFGYGVNGDETYPYFLSKLLDEPVHNSGVPAYGSASNYLYAKSNIEKIKPKTVIYLTLGMYARSNCKKPWRDYVKKGLESRLSIQKGLSIRKGGLYQEQLIPCYLINQTDFKVKLIKPLPGNVEESVKNNIYPGGSLTAGYDSFWRYVFFTKPKLVIKSLKIRLGLTKLENPSEFELYHMRKYELNSFLDLAYKNNFQFVLVDPNGNYKQILVNKEAVNVQNLIYIGKSDWSQHVTKKSQGMPSADQRVPMDGHFGKGINKLIANLIYQKVFAKKPNLAN
jgi:hypothetical protein